MNFTAALSTGNTPFASNVTVNGVSTLNATNTAVVLGSAAFVAGFSGNVTGLKVVNENSSLGTIQLGGLGQGLNTLLTNVNINNYAAPLALGGTAMFAGIVSPTVASAAATINVAITGNVGSSAYGLGGLIPTPGANYLIFANSNGGGTAANPNLSYGTWAITSNNNSFLTLQQDFNGFIAGAALLPVPGGVGAATSLVLSGPGNVAVGQDGPGNWQKLKSIDASGQVGNVTITGASSVLGPLLAPLAANSNAFGTLTAAGALGGANPGWAFGSPFGLLNDPGGTFALTSYKGTSTGTNILDISSANLAQVAALTATGNTATGVQNQLVVSDAVATTLSKTTFANVTNFQQLDVGGPTKADGLGGFIDMANLPKSINTIVALTAAQTAAAITINNQVSPLTVLLEDNTKVANTLTVGKVGPAAGLSDSLTIGIGNDVHSNVTATLGKGTIGDITVAGDELFTLSSFGAGSLATAAKFNSTGLITLTPTLAGNEQVTIDGHADIAIGTTLLGAIVDTTTGGVLNLNNMIINDVNTGITVFTADTTAGTLLNFATGTKGAPAIGYSTNAVTIDASKSGGLIMSGGDANFVPAATAKASTGDTITGASDPVGLKIGAATIGNILIGSIGNDTIVSKSVNLPDYIVTEGGADTITLAAGHTGADHVGFYAGLGVTAASDGVPSSVAAAITGANAAGVEFARPGWWGTGAGGDFTKITDAALTGTGTSGSLSTLTNFNAKVDFLDFSVKAWDTSAEAFGLTQDSGALGTVAGATGAGVSVFAKQVAPGGSIVGTAAAPTDLIVLNTGDFLNADAVAANIKNGAYTLVHSTLAAR